MNSRRPKVFEGFEVWWNEQKMWGKYIFLASLIFLGLYTLGFLWLKSHSLTEMDRVNLLAYLKGEVCTISRLCPDREIPYLGEKGWQWARAEDLAEWGRKPFVAMVTRILAEYIVYYLFLNIFVLVLASCYFYRHSRKELHSEQIIRGQGLIPPRKLSKRLKRKYGKGRLKLSKKVTLPRALEPRHVFVVGATGTGKTAFLSRQVDTLKGKEKGLILDIKGDYTSRFYDPDRDLILNPLDRRSVVWMPLFDLEDPAQADGLAASFIPPLERGEGVEAYFRDAARDVLASIFLVAKAKGITKNPEIWGILSSGLKGIIDFLADHPLGRKGLAHIEKIDSNQAAGILSTLMQFCRVFEWLQGLDGDFSLRQWIREDGPGFLFFPIPPQYREALAPFVTAAINTIILEILSWPDDLERRRFIFVDELGALQKLPALVDGLTQGRSKGLSLWIGIQDFGRIDALYGREIRETIWGNCTTRVVLRVVAPETADYLSRALGEIEVEDSKKTYSIGVEDVKDGLSYMRMASIKRLVLPSQIAELPDLSAFLSVASFPPAKDKIPLKAYKAKHEPFLARKLTEMFSKVAQEERKEEPERKEDKDKEAELY